MATQTSPQFLRYDLGAIGSESVIEVTLTNAANVLLMDSANFTSYQNGQAYRYYGGYVRTSPYKIRPPHQAHWHVAIDLGGAAGTVRASVRVIRGNDA
ncbi:MAG TPA: DUF1883 domain-containing protein [Pirellulaceae bacterium]|jgi:hypothetical protein